MRKKTLQEMLSAIAGELRENRRWGTAHIYEATLNTFEAFREHEEQPLNKITPMLLKEFEMYLRHRNCSWNTVSTYIKTVRSAYNRAVDKGYAAYIPRLFERVYTGTRADRKRALEAAEMGVLIRKAVADLPQKTLPTSLQKTQKLFAFMFWVYPSDCVNRKLRDFSRSFLFTQSDGYRRIKRHKWPKSARSLFWLSCPKHSAIGCLQRH
ncbi:phage integrase SAM-like domain-containing protein [Bacteroides zoogleoformans]|uniref:phage integrase SAM-like domain-containing protein n=1 Tax=Bacteroides zoogleoformans TaxID=28119 RepID=UPI00248D9E1A|nr:phage integrase SAM-like domain-containing protein [Bacteroides zoogleoformans]